MARSIQPFALLLGLAVCTPAFAATATITRIDGNVMVNQGEQFVPAQTGQVLSTGDRIMAPADGGSSLTFDDGCVMTVQPDTLVTIPSTSPCKGGDAVTQRVTPQGNTAVGTRPYMDNAFGWGAMATIAAITVYMVSRGDEDDDDTASP